MKDFFNIMRILSLYLELWCWVVPVYEMIDKYQMKLNNCKYDFQNNKTCIVTWLLQVLLVEFNEERRIF